MMKLKPWLIAVAILAVLAFGFYKLWNYEGIRFFGDEPHYLIMTRSLLLDGDLNLTNDYTEPARYQDFYKGPLDQHVSQGQRHKSGSIYSLHGAGIPILLYPFMKYLGLVRGVVGFMCLWGGLVCILAWLWVRRHINSSAWATVTVAALVLSMSFLSLVGHVFPDFIIAALLLSTALLLITKKLHWYHYLGISLIVGIFPWIHVKTLLYAAATGLLGLWRWWKSKDRSWANFGWLVGPAAILLGGYELSLLSWYGTLIPTKAFASSGQLFQTSPLVYYGGGLFDVTRGLISNNPALLLVFVGLPVWFKKSRSTFWLVLWLLVPTLVLQSTFGDWWGGWSPTGRYWMEFIPLLLPALGFLLTDGLVWIWRSLLAILMLVQLEFAKIYLLAKPSWQLPGQPNLIFQTLQLRHHLNLVNWWPNFGRPATAKLWPNTVGLMIIILGLAVLSRFSDRAKDRSKKTA